MNINRNSINILLKFTVIFSIVFGAINSVSADTTNESTISTSFWDSFIDINWNFSILTILIILFISWYLNKKEQQKKIDNITKNQITIISNLNQLNAIDNKLHSLDKIKREIIKQIQDNNQKVTDFKIEILDHISKQQSSQSINDFANTGINSSNHFDFSISAKEQIKHQLDAPSYNPVAVAERVPQFVERYNLDKSTLFNEAIAKVVTTEASINKRRLGDEGKLILENTTQKKYLIVQEDSDFYLVPHAKINIDEYNITTLEALFECINFNPEYDDFHLIQPAKVSQLDSELWQLDQKGKLEFS